MNEIILVKMGELTLKGGNRKGFEQILRRNLITMLRARSSGSRTESRSGRIYIHCVSAEAADLAEEALSCLMGIAGWARAQKTEKTLDKILTACVKEGKKLFESGARSFKIESRRTDKSFSLNSYDICCAAGDAVLQEAPGLRVDVKHPDATISVEIREKAYVYGSEKKGRQIGRASCRERV